jgi:predicted aconitase with swiveling domain
MNSIAVATFTARHAMGQALEAECLSAHDGFSARYDLNRLEGTFSRPAHKLFGQSYHGKILVLDTAKGGVASAWMLYEISSVPTFFRGGRAAEAQFLKFHGMPLA